MIKNAILYYGMPLTGKSTLLLKQCIKDHGQDLCINFWTFLHYDRKRAKTRTLPDISSPHGRIGALRLPYNPNLWIKTLSQFHARHPKIKRVMLDECQCISSVYLVTLTSIIRIFYPNVPITLASIDFDSWHHKLPRIKNLIKLVPKSKHLHHKCMFCHRVANRRLHVIDNHPAYNQKKYEKLLNNREFSRKHHFNMYSVCLHHYYNPPKDIPRHLLRPFRRPRRRVNKRAWLHKLGLKSDVKVKIKH